LTCPHEYICFDNPPEQLFEMPESEAQGQLKLPQGQLKQLLQRVFKTIISRQAYKKLASR
jgi:hypothetical protein